MQRNDSVRARGMGSAGFTLIEIMVVVFILGLLASLATVRLMSTRDKAKVGAAKGQIAGLAQAVKMFSLDNGRFPDSAEGLAALLPPPPTDLPHYDPVGYLETSRIPLDPWDRPFEYRLEGRTFAIISYGADGRPGGEGLDADLDSRTL